MTSAVQNSPSTTSIDAGDDEEPQAPPEPAPPPDLEIYAQLAYPFEFTYELEGNTYITVEQVVSRLNHVLGVGGWSFRLIERWLDQEADHVCTHGQIEAEIDGRKVVREQFGSKRIGRLRSTGAPMDIGKTWKASGTDTLKKCAMLLGVGLYLADKSRRAQPAQQQQRQQTSRPVAKTAAPPRQPNPTGAPPNGANVKGIPCANCHENIQAATVNGTLLQPYQIATAAATEFRRPLCLDCQELARHNPTAT